MTKKIKGILSIIVIIMLMAMSVRVDTYAAGGLSISASSSEVSEGDTFTVTVSGASNYFVADIQLSVSGGTTVSGLSKSSLDRGESASATIKLTGDSCTVTVSGTGANYDTEEEGSASASVTVSKKAEAVEETPAPTPSAPETKKEEVVDNRSKDNKLASLTVSEGTLSPEFSSGTTEYTVNVGGTVETITLSAEANDAKASVSGTGEKTLVPGNNSFTIVCTAENGSKKSYNITVYVDETPVVYTTYKERKLGVVRNQTDLGIPATFEATTVQLEDQEVPAYQSGQYNLTILYLVDEAGEKNFYIYEAEKGITSVFLPVAILGRNLVIYDLTEEEQVRENMVYTQVEIDGVTLYGWVYDNPDYADYIQIQVLNEFGEKVMYQYEKTENSLQLYKEYVEVEEVVEEEEKTLFPNEYYMYALVGLGALVIVLGTSLICVVVKMKGSSHKMEGENAVEAKEEEETSEEPVE